jgi:TonB-linked SusC/RagA family outer membrane protein
MKKLPFLFLLMLFVGFTASAQMQISGKVTNAETGDPIPGVSIVVENETTIGTSTDMDGNYSLQVPSDAETLVFSFVGMQQKEVDINGRTSIDVKLQPTVQEMEEIVVTAFGTTKKASFTGSADVVGAEKIEDQNISNITKGLEGIAPGIQVQNSSGQPGADSEIRIRGFGSVNASSDPLYVVDGVPYSGSMNSINPSDIESITVLKDATATALYGARGANGVINITTKSGEQTEGTTISYNYEQGFSARAYPEYERVNSEEYVELMWEAYRNSLYYNDIYPSLEEAGEVAAQGDPDEDNAHVISKLGNYNPFDMAAENLIDPNTGNVDPGAELLYGNNWQDEMFRFGNRGEHLLSFSGSTEKTNYYMSAGYLSEKGIVRNSDFERFTAKVNVNSQIKDWLKAGFNLNGSTADQNYLMAYGTYTSNPFYYTRAMGPIYPVYIHDEEGNIVRDDNGNKKLDYGNRGSMVRPYAANSNIVGTTDLDTQNQKTENLITRAYVEVDFLKNFTFKSTLGADYMNLHDHDYQNSRHGDAAAFNGRTAKINERKISVNLNEVLTYDNDFGAHSVNVLVGHESYKLNDNYITATRTGFPFYGVEELAMASTGEGSNSWRDEYRIEGYFSRVKYNYDNRYYITGSYRRDGSSRFHEDYRWGDFFSIGGSWRMSEESFMAGVDWVDDFKVKASYGEQGNDRLLVGDGPDAGTEQDPMYYGYNSFYSTLNNYSYSGFYLSQLPNRTLQWEVSENLNAGIEFSLFDRVSGEINYFEKGSSQLLFDNPRPMSTGLSFVKDNVGAMENRGIEATLNVDIIKADNTRWRLGGSITSFKNEITELPKEEIISGTKKLMVGRSLYDYFIRQYAGVDPETGKALYYKDVLDEEGNPTGERETTTNTDEATKYYSGTAIPDFTGSLNSNFSYKGFNFSFLFTYGVGGKMLNYTYSRLMHAGDYGTNFHANIKDRWQEPGDQTDVPRLENGYDDANYPSDRFLFDRSYLNIKNVRLSYNVPRNLFSQMGLDLVKQFQVYVSGNDLYLFTNLQGMNPQESFAGITDYQYTPTKTIMVGANIKF